MVVKDVTVRVDGEFICLTDIAKSGRSPSGDIIKLLITEPLSAGRNIDRGCSRIICGL